MTRLHTMAFGLVIILSSWFLFAPSQAFAENVNLKKIAQDMGGVFDENEPFDISKGHSGTAVEQLRSLLKTKSGHFVVEFHSAIMPTDLRNLQTLGVHILRYVPDNSLVFMGSGKQALTVNESSRRIKSVRPYPVEWKIAEDVDWKIAEDIKMKNDGESRILNLSLFPNMNLSRIRRQIKAIRGAGLLRADSVNDSALHVRVSSLRALESIGAIDGVEWIEDAAQEGRAHESQVVVNLQKSNLQSTWADLGELLMRIKSISIPSIELLRAAMQDEAKKIKDAVFIAAEDGIGTGEQHSYSMTVTKRSHIRAILDYFDPDPSPRAPAGQSVNQLDLIVINKATGQESRVSQVDGSEHSSEHLLDWTAEPGDYELRVSGKNVPLPTTGERQSYAIVVAPAPE